MGLWVPTRLPELVCHSSDLGVPGEPRYRRVIRVQVAADPGYILGGHLQALVDELADCTAPGGASEDTSDEG